jgi:hypothetical protein
MNSMLRSLELGQGFTLPCASGGDDGIKLTLEGDEAGRLISMVLGGVKLGIGLGIGVGKAGHLSKTTSYTAMSK